MLLSGRAKFKFYGEKKGVGVVHGSDRPIRVDEDIIVMKKHDKRLMANSDYDAIYVEDKFPAGYAFTAGSDHVWAPIDDSRENITCPAWFFNTALRKNDANVKAIYDPDTDCIIFRAIKKIYKGDELLLWYGQKYVKQLKCAQV